MNAALNPSIVGRAEKAHNAVLYRALADTSVDETQWITLVLAVAADDTVDRAQHIADVAQAARFDPPTVDAAIDALLRESLLIQNSTRLTVSTAGSAFVARTRAATGPVVARAYAGIAEADLATAAGVLTEITARLSAELEEKLAQAVED